MIDMLLTIITLIAPTYMVVSLIIPILHRWFTRWFRPYALDLNSGAVRNCWPSPWVRFKKTIIGNDGVWSALRIEIEEWLHENRISHQFTGAKWVSQRDDFAGRIRFRREQDRAMFKLMWSDRVLTGPFTAGV